MSTIPAHIADDLTPDDIRKYCDQVNVEFHRMGTPPGVDDANGLGWDDKTVFRVATLPGMMGGSPRGITVTLDKVRLWKKGMTELTPAHAAALDEMIGAIHVIGTVDEHMAVSFLQQSLRRGEWHLYEPGALALHASQPFVTAIANLDPAFAIGTPVDNVIAGVDTGANKEGIQAHLEDLLRTMFVSMIPRERELFLDDERTSKIVKLGQDLSQTAAPGL